MTTQAASLLQLVDEMTRGGVALSPPLRAAFLEIPRHRFLSAYYEQGQWRQEPCETEEAFSSKWLEAVYQDRALVTQIDERGLPTSSSSQPSVMAAMLEQLDLHRGQRVLEIGTGAGYNAALLAALVGDPTLITSIDLDPLLIKEAAPRIAQTVGEGMHLIAGNGLEGYVPNAPYDRIVATGSFPSLPQAWVEQLAPRGKLVMDLRGHFGGGLITCVKDQQGRIVGRFWTQMQEISFMPLRQESQQITMIARSPANGQMQEEHFCLPVAASSYRCAAHFLSFGHVVRHAWSFWLQWAFPTLSIGWGGTTPEELNAYLLDHSSGTRVVISRQAGGIEMLVQGSRPLWIEIFLEYLYWQMAGEPDRGQYDIQVPVQGSQGIWVQCTNGQRRLFPHALLAHV